MVNNLLSAAEVWRTIGSVALAILILIVMIVIHEFGHYLAGKLFHFKIDEFSVGFGPAIFKRRSKKSGELFALRIIPLGGYCSFAGEDGLDGEESDPSANEPFPEAASDDSAKEPLEAASDDSVKKEKETSDDSVKKEEKASDNTAKKEEAAQTDDRSGWFTNRPCWQRLIVLVSGAAMNYLLALFLIIIGFVSYGQTMVAAYAVEPSEEYAAFSLADKDIFLQADGKNLYLTSDIAKAVNGKSKGDIVKFRVSRIVGVENGKNIREEMDVEIMLRADVEVKNSADFTGVWNALGVKYYEATEETEAGYALANAVYKFGFWEGLGRAFVYSFKIAGSIFQILGELLTGKLGLSAFGGPVTTITMTSQIVSRGFRYLLEISGYIGVNLAVFNLLPIPALDGSKVVFTLIEWIRGKPVNRKVEAIIHAVGFILLLGFAVLVDILQFV